MRLKYFLVLCLVLGAVVTPIASKKCLEWKRQRESTAIIDVKAAEAVLSQLHGEAVKPDPNTAVPRLALRADSHPRAITVFASPPLIEMVRGLIEAMDVPSSPIQQTVPIQVTPGNIQCTLKKVLPESNRPLPNDLSHVRVSIDAA